MAVKPGQLARLLGRTSRRTRAVAAAARLLGALSLLAVIAAALLFFDAQWPLTPPRLAAWGVALMGIAGVLLIHAAWRAFGERIDPRRIARRIESRAGILHNRLVNAIELAAGDPSFGSVELSRLAAAEGEAAAEALRDARLVDRRPLRRAARVFAAVALVIGGLAALWPGVFLAGIPRFLEPRRDHPPYTPLGFEVVTVPETARQGERAEISVRIEGDEWPAQADVIWSGETKVRQPMSRAGDGRFVLRIERAERTREFFIDTPRGRSRRHVFKVEPAPAASAPDRARDGKGLSKRGEEIGGEIGAFAARLKRLSTGANPRAAEEADAIGELAAGLAREAGEQQARMGAESAAGAALRAALGELGDAAAEGSAAARSASDSLRSADRGEGDGGAGALDQAGRELMRKARELAETQRRMGRGTGDGAGRGDGEGTEGSANGSADATPPNGPATTGQRAERIDPGAVGVAGEAGGDMTGVPLPYRDAAAAYFRRLAEEAR